MKIEIQKYSPTVGRTKALWLENRPDIIQGWVNVLNEDETVGMEVEIVNNVYTMKEMILTNPPDLLILDIQLNQKIDGIGIAKVMRQKDPILPIRIVSSYLNDYMDRLLGIPNIAGIHDRDEFDNQGFSAFKTLIANDAFAHKLYNKIGIHKMTWFDFIEHPQKRIIFKVHWMLFSKWVREIIMQKGLAWAVVCGKQIVSSSKDIKKFPTLEKKEIIGKKYGLVPFVYSRPIHSEEGIEKNIFLPNLYPKVNIRVGSTNGIANIDTGTNQTLVSDNLCKPEEYSMPEEGEHFNLKYEYFINQKQVYFKNFTKNGVEIGPIMMPVAIVDDWDKSPWIKVNSRRMALVGRDIFAMDKIELKIESDEKLKKVITHIKLK